MCSAMNERVALPLVRSSPSLIRKMTRPFLSWDQRPFGLYASADLGLIAYESEALEGMILDEALILEIVRPGTGDPLPEGEVGEVVITTFNADYPLIRFGTGDLSAVLRGTTPRWRDRDAAYR